MQKKEQFQLRSQCKQKKYNSLSSAVGKLALGPSTSTPIIKNKDVEAFLKHTKTWCTTGEHNVADSLLATLFFLL